MKTKTLAAAVLLGLAAADQTRFSRVQAAADGNVPVIKPLMLLRPQAGASNEYELIIYGDIGESWWGESVTAQSIVAQLAALDDSVTQINVRLNSYGGSVSDGLAIYNVLKRHAAKKVGSVDGVAMSSASLIAMACDELQMPAASMLMIHAPWGLVQGNAADMRVMADVLDSYATAMSSAYSSKSGMSTADVLKLLSDGVDHYYTGEQAVAAGFADSLIEPAPEQDPAPQEDDPAAARAAARPRGLTRFTARATPQIAAMVIAAAQYQFPGAGIQASAAPRTQPRGAHSPQHEERTMETEAERLAAKAKADAEAAAKAAAEKATAAAIAAVRERNIAIQAALKPVMEIAGVRSLYEEALADPTLSMDTINARALALAGAGASPSQGAHVEAGKDQSDKDVEAMSGWLLARSNAEQSKGKIVLANAAPDNPFRGYSLYALAEHCVRSGGVNTARMNRGEIVATAMRPKAAAGLTSSDFPNLLENTLNKLLVAAYTGAPTTWQRFCRITDLVDFRANPRYRIGTFSDLAEVNEAGDYEQGTVGDAERESITGKRKGRILVVSREMIVNDDLQAFADVARGLGKVANRTVDKDIYALFALNGGNGPTMGDGKTLFHADHANIAAIGAAPGVAPFEAARVQMAQQKDPSGNDFLDVRPDVWLGPIGIGGSARVTNNSLYDPDAASKLQRPNIVNGLFSDIVDTPRLAGTPWYALANKDEEPVFEVGFVGGQRLPIVEQERDFDSDGLRWKVVLEYGTAATGWRGAVKNAGA